MIITMSLCIYLLWLEIMSCHESSNVPFFLAPFFQMTGCAESYNMSVYPTFNGTYSHVNEQRNSELKKLKSQLSYMFSGKFMEQLTLPVG